MSKKNSNIKGKKITATSKMAKAAKIEKLPKNVKESIPFKGVLQNGIIETYPGVFTHSYKIEDVNFKIATEEEQAMIFSNYMDLLNSFDNETKWQFTIYNHKIDKKTTLDNIRIVPQRDGLNKYRHDMNNILLSNLAKGNNSIIQDKFLTVSIEDSNLDHAVASMNRIDSEISQKIRRINKREVEPMTIEERLRTLYSIYNQDTETHLMTGVDEYGEEKFDLTHIYKQGLSVKDVIGPVSIDFSKGSHFMLGDTYAQALYLEKVPAYLSTDFISDIAEVQSNMLISITHETMEPETAIKMVKNQVASIEAQVAQTQKRNSEDGFFGALPPELEKSQEAARELMRDITGRNQNLFFVTVTVVVFADSKTELEENVKMVRSVGAKHICPLKILKYQQEFGFNTALPLARNDLFVERLYTTESAAVFIPFNAQEINQKNAIFYGLNQVTKSMVMYNRLSAENYNGLIFGYSGSGKSFTAKCEMINVLLKDPDAQVFVIDPNGEYYPLADALYGERIILAPSSNVFINPLDLDISSDSENDVDPTTLKSDYVLSMLEIMLGKGRTLDPICRTIVDRCVRKIYKGYIQQLRSRTDGVTFDSSQCPTLSDLYQELLAQEEYQAHQLADILEMYTAGGFNTFSHRTNVETNARFVVYDIKNLGSGMRELGLNVCLNDIWNRMMQNSRKGKRTYFYIDEFHLLLQSEATTTFLKTVWKVCRKFNGIPTAITQESADFLRSADTRSIVNQSSFVIMLKEPRMERQNLAELFNLSDEQLKYIDGSDPGHGLMFNGKVTIPFGLKFPRNSELYKIMTTSHDVKDAKFS